MLSLEYIVIISTFLIYYIAILWKEHKIIKEPAQIIAKFLAVTLFWAGVSLIYYSITGQPFLQASADSYNVYIFIIGFVAILWTIPELLEEFDFFKKFEKKKKPKKK